MIKDLQVLTPQEIDLVYNAPLLTSILISGADGNIDKKEISTAINFAKKNAKRSRAMLYQFYTEIAEDYENKLQSLIEAYPDDVKKRNEIIVGELKQLNHIFEKVSKAFTIVYYVSLKEIAKKIAQSSGGFFWLFKISKEEANFIELPMLKDPADMFS